MFWHIGMLLISAKRTTSEAMLSKISGLTSGALIKSGKFSVKSAAPIRAPKGVVLQRLGKRERFLVEDVQPAAFLGSFFSLRKRMNNKTFIKQILYEKVVSNIIGNDVFSAFKSR